MDFKQLKSGIKEISEIAASVPEPFRLKCFETLLNGLLAEENPPHELRPPKDSAKKDDVPPKPPASPTAALSPIQMNSQLRLLTLKGAVTEDELNKVVFAENGEVNFVQEPHPSGIREGQLEWSLLMALKNGILKNVLEADAEEIRSKCIDAGFYDKANFAANFKSQKFTALFKGTLKAQGPAVALSPEGQLALAALIKRLASEAK
jgi:hypothetical protein